MQKTVTTDVSVGFDPIHPMRAKEAIILPRLRTPEMQFPSPDFYSKEKKGLEVSGGVLQDTRGGSVATVFVPTDGSNIHALFLISSSNAAATDHLTKQLPRSYVTHFNQEPQEDLHTLLGLGTHTREAMEQTLNQTEEYSDGHATVAFAHVVPKNGRVSHAVIGLEEGTLALMTYSDERDATVRTTLFTPQSLGPANAHGMHIGEFPLLAGAKLVLTTDLSAYQQQHGLEELAAFYELSEPMLAAMRSNNLDLFRSLPPSMLEHLMFSISPFSLEKSFQELTRKGNDMAAAAKLAAYGLAHLAKDEHGNYMVPERIAFIGSRIPRKAETKRRAAA